MILWNYFKLNIKKYRKKIKYLSLPFVLLILIYVQIIIGAFVSGMDAGMIYNSWPLMGNTYFPDDNNVVKNLFNFSAFSDPSLVQFLQKLSLHNITFLYNYIV